MAIDIGSPKAGKKSAQSSAGHDGGADGADEAHFQVCHRHIIHQCRMGLLQADVIGNAVEQDAEHKQDAQFLVCVSSPAR